jgi:hypothetical protein
MEHFADEVNLGALPLEAELPPVVDQALVHRDRLRLRVGGHEEVLALGVELHVCPEYLFRARRQPLRQAAVGVNGLMPPTQFKTKLLVKCESKATYSPQPMWLCASVAPAHKRINGTPPVAQAQLAHNHWFIVAVVWLAMFKANEKPPVANDEVLALVQLVQHIGPLQVQPLAGPPEEAVDDQHIEHPAVQCGPDLGGHREGVFPAVLACAHTYIYCGLQLLDGLSKTAMRTGAHRRAIRQRAKV